MIVLLSMMPPSFDTDTKGSEFEDLADVSKMLGSNENSYLSD